MLVLARRQGESLRIRETKITVLNIYKKRIKLDVNDSEDITINLQKAYQSATI